MYYSGHGVGIDKTKAYVWFNLAAAQGHQNAAEAATGCCHDDGRSGGVRAAGGAGLAAVIEKP